MGTFKEPLVADTKTSQIRRRLTDAIINGDLRPGDRIVLDEIARELGVSKIPLREALSSLEGAGLVVSTPHSGPRVAPLPSHEIHGIYLLREEVESLALRLAFTHVDDALVAELRSINDTMTARLSHADQGEMSDLNSEFHLTIARATTFTTIVESVDDLLTKVRRYRSVMHGMATNWDGAVAEHNEIIEALEARDETAALETMRRHVERRALIETTAPNALDPAEK